MKKLLVILLAFIVMPAVCLAKDSYNSYKKVTIVSSGHQPTYHQRHYDDYSYRSKVKVVVVIGGGGGHHHRHGHHRHGHDGYGHGHGHHGGH